MDQKYFGSSVNALKNLALWSYIKIASIGIKWQPHIACVNEP